MPQATFALSRIPRASGIGAVLFSSASAELWRCHLEYNLPYGFCAWRAY